MTPAPHHRWTLVIEGMQGAVFVCRDCGLMKIRLYEKPATEHFYAADGGNGSLPCSVRT